MPTDVIIDPSTGQIYWNDNTGSPQSISIKGDALNAISVTGYSASFSPGSAVGGTTTLVTFNDNSGTAALVPGTSGFDLGTSTLRWKLFSTTGNFSDTTNSTSLLTGAVLVNGGIAISANASIGQTLLLFSGANYTGFRSSATGNTVYTLPATSPATGTSVLQSDTSGTLSWTGIVGTATTSQNINVVSATTSASHPVLFTPSSGTASGAALSTESTFVYNPSTDILSVSGLAVTATTASTDSGTGALRVAGGVGISGRLSVDTNSQIFASFGGITNSLSYVQIQNTSSGASAYSQLWIRNNDSQGGVLIGVGATDATQINSFNGNIPVGYGYIRGVSSGFPFAGTNGGLSVGAGSTLILSTGTSGNRLTLSGTGVSISHSITSTSTSTGALVVVGGVGIGGSIFGGSTISAADNIEIRSGKELRLNNSGNTFYTGIKAGANTSNTTYTFPVAFPGSGTSVLQSDTSGTLTWTGIVGNATTASNINVVSATTSASHPVLFTPSSGTASGAAVSSESTFVYNPSTDILSVSGLAITATTASTSPTTGALVVSGGVGISGRLLVGRDSTISKTNVMAGFASSVNGLSGAKFILQNTSPALFSNVKLVFANDLNNEAEISFQNSNSSSNNQGLLMTNDFGNITLTAGTAKTVKLQISSVSSLLQFNSIGVFIEHITPSTSSTTGALVVTGGVGIGGSLYVGGTGSSISGVRISSAAIFSGDTTFALINTNATTVNAFGAATTMSIGAATGKATFNSTDNSTTVNTGGLIVSGGAGIAKSLSVGGHLQLFNTNFYTSFVSASTANTVYTLPPTSPATGSSVLQSTSAGVMSWVPLAASSSGGTVYAGVLNQLAFYGATGNTVGGASGVTYNPTSGLFYITHTTASTSTSTGALVVAGGVGIGGNAFIGGTINVGSPITIPNGGTNASSFGQSAGFIYYDGANVRLLAASGATINYSNGYYQFDNRVYATSFFAGGAQMPNGSGIAGRVTIWSGNNTIGSDAEFTYDSTSNILNVSGNINAIGFTASGVAITSGTASTSTTTGALVVAGGVGISGRLTFNQASFGTTGITTVPTMAMIGQTGDPIFMSVLEDNSISFEGSQGQLFSISPNLTTGYIWAVNDISGVPLLRSSVGGTIGIAEFGGVVGIGQTNPIYKLDLKGSFGLASSNDSLYNFIFSNTAASGSNSLQIRSANSLLLYNSGNTFYTGFKSNAATNVTYTLPTTDGSSGQFLQTNGTGTLTWATATGGGGGSGSTGVNAGGEFEIGYYASTGSSISGSSTFKNNTSTGVVSITHTTASTNFSNGAFTVSGGVGIGGSLYVGGTGSSISGVRIASGTITAGAWNGTVIGVQYGGTGQNLAGQSGILTISGGTVSNSTTSSAIASALSDETGSGSLVFATQPSFGTGVTTGNATFAVFNTNATTINAFGAATTISLGAATGTATFNSTNNTTAANTGAVVFSGGVGIGRSVSIGGRLLLFNGATYTGFLSSQVGSGSTVYTLPSSSPATGTSVLQSDSSGIMSWVPMVASGGAGSGTVAIPGSQFEIAAYYHSATGASVSGSSTFKNNTSTAQVTITHNTVSTSTSTGALAVSGGLGLAGNAFIGGTINVPSTSTSNISNVLFTNGIVSSGTWAATAVTAFYGGTGFNSYTKGDILVGFGNTFIRQGVGADNFVLTASATSPSGVTWASVPPAAASSVAVIPTTLPQSFFITTVSSSSGSGLGLSTITSFVVNPSTGIVSLSGLAVTNTTATTSTSSGALIVSGGMGLAGNAFIGGTVFVPSTTASNFSNLLVSNTTATTSTTSGALVVSGGLGLAGNAFIGGTVFVPSTTPSNFSNLLVSNSTSSTGTNSGALVVGGGMGLAGNAFIGGTTTITSTTASVSSESGALVIRGGVGIGQSISIAGSLNIFNGANYSGFRFAGSANTTYILPPRTPTGTGSSYLSSGIDGVMAWVAAPTGGGGTPGGSNKQIQYNNSTAFGGASGFEYTTGGTAITVSMFSPTGTGYTAGLWVHAINGSTTRVGIGLSNPAFELEILGEISATNKSFVIDHPTKDGMKLRYGSLEGPENGVYVRGELKNSNIIEVPDHWLGLVHPDSYTVHLTPIGKYAQLYVEKIENYNVFVADANMNPIHCYYSVWAERKDIPKLITEYEAQ